LSFLFSIQIVHIAHVDLIGVIFHENCLRGVNMELEESWVQVDLNPVEMITARNAIKDETWLHI
jgi:hypothetical protein